MKQIMEWIGDRPAVLAGDFNNRPEERSIKMVKETGRFAGEWDGAPTYFDEARKERIDFIFAPTAWTHLESKVIADDTSDHRPLVSRFKLPG
jgi:endonuclease/exonuclease/phosphatase (EEP) superfamily protein YafD